MATAAQWLEGARPRTLPAAVSPVVAGSGAALLAGRFDAGVAVLCLVVALGLQVGVNYANDYSDGIRGTDAVRVGPMRLVGSEAASPPAVKRAAFAAFGVAAVAGLAVVALSGEWWLLLVGVAAILAAWFYTGGSHPYGYAGLGEVVVFVFFGLVAVMGTTYVQAHRVTAVSVIASVAVGLVACQVLVANNLRDIHGDREVGKRTLATRLGDRGTRVLYLAMSVVVAAAVIVLAALTSWWALLGVAGVVLLAVATRSVVAGATGRDLVRVLQLTGMAELSMAVGLALGWVLP
ncbi:MAG TPA: 1,4-dihydroxy-2-naphthoate polyprenyltransferase [Propionibacteriaceae bacterium]|nr:1,4-dihydroxy-2-naphthoate polyprenyltransferase [Propionibacteriaceae bacterium]